MLPEDNGRIDPDDQNPCFRIERGPDNRALKVGGVKYLLCIWGRWE